jgi:hypothetical protein
MQGTTEITREIAVSPFVGQEKPMDVEEVKQK